MSKPKFKIHFVCTGNTFRSRMAEAYLKSLKTNIEVSSSGTNAKHDFNGPICWYAQRILLYNKFIPFLKRDWTQTTKKLLNTADLVIFIGKKNYEFCKDKFNFKGKYKIWKIPDLDEIGFNIEPFKPNGKGWDMEVKKIKFSEKIFSELKAKVDELIKTRIMS